MPSPPLSVPAEVTTVESTLPLNLFHVLEEEYVAVHGPLPANHPDWSVKPDQIINARVIIEALKKAANEPPGRPDPATEFSRHLLRQLPGRPDKRWVSQLTDDSLVAVLNDLLAVPTLYNAQAVQAVELRDETREFARVHCPKGRVELHGDDLRRFNRLLLEDAYPKAMKRINDVRMNAIIAKIHEAPTAALCLSGGGIRSGTFALGIVQGLAKRGLLSQFHYLSTVSGGGYIGSWLTAWSHRHEHRLDGVIHELRKQSDSQLEPEPEPLRHLREYSNFVAPRPNLTSADIWSFVATYLRNLLINWAALIPLMLAVLLLPRIVVAALYESAGAPLPWIVVYGLLVAGFVLSVIGVFYVTVNRPSRSDLLLPSSRLRAHRDQGSFLKYSLAPTVVAAVFLTTFWAWYRAGGTVEPPSWSWLRWLTTQVATLPLWVVLVAVGITVYLLAIALAFIILRHAPAMADLSAAVFTGGGGGFLAWLLMTSVFAEPAPGRYALLPDAAWYACLAVPAYLLVFFGSAAIFVAATSKRLAIDWNKQWFAIEDEDREWLGRYGGWLLIIALGWVVASGLVVFGPVLLLASPKILAAFGGVSGVVSVLGGKSALSPATDKNARAQGWKAMLFEHALSIAAMIFLAVLVATLSWLTSLGVAKLMDALALVPGSGWGIATVLQYTGQFAVLYFSPMWLLVTLALLTAGVGFLAGWMINLNKFSLHAAYRARIIRAFLGGSRQATERLPNPFTDFDPQDNVQMHELRPGLLREASFHPGGLTGLVVKLRDSQKDGNTDEPSQQLYEQLSPGTQRLLGNHSGRNPPSQSLKRNLLEDLNRVLDGDPGLLGIDFFAQAQSSEHTRKLIATLLREGCESSVVSPSASNQVLSEKLPIHGRTNAMLVLNRAILDSIYTTELVPLRGPPPPYRLLHVIGTALNLVGGKRLAWQQRRAESFSISPLHCGSLYRGYRRSRTYGGLDGISLGTAVTISGAAVSSNMGYHSSSAAVTFALTLFNARLGWWLGNPGAAGADRRYARFALPPYRRAFPRLSLAPLVMEAFGLTDDTSRYVLLSDGGHFDNLGLYEMVLRRCRFIVAVDASQDEHATFDDIGATVRKIRIDFGIDIVFEQPVAIYKKGHPEIEKGNGRYCAVATIHYPDGDDRLGLLLYIKPGILGDEPRDVLQYAIANPAFPHQSTLDQLFDESQFESYRRLGEHVVASLCGDAIDQDMTIRAFVDRLYTAHFKRKEPPREVLDLVKDL
jgi:Patatin-like phospholipase